MTQVGNSLDSDLDLNSYKPGVMSPGSEQDFGFVVKSSMRPTRFRPSDYFLFSVKPDTWKKFEFQIHLEFSLA